MPTRKCIYCLQELETSKFDTEHVLPRAFGTFANNLTLNCVCTGCNEYFGWNLELFLGRDSMEALRRIRYGLKPLKELGDLPLDRLSISMGTEDDWEGVHLAPKDEEGQLVYDLVPQVGFRKKGGEGWIYLTEEELADASRPIPDGVDIKGEIKTFARSDAEMGCLIGLLRKRGIPFQKKGPVNRLRIEGGRGPAKITYHIDDVIRRCVAKIAFNYMAWVAEADFVSHSGFDAARSHIRQGISPQPPIVVPSNQPILADDTATQRQTRGHLITLTWPCSAADIVGQVSLFNDITYKICLARNFSGIWQDIRSGHHFDINRHRIDPLSRRSMMP